MGFSSHSVFPRLQVPFLWICASWLCLYSSTSALLTQARSQCSSSTPAMDLESFHDCYWELLCARAGMDMRSHPQNLWGGIGSPVPGRSLSLTAIIPLLAFTGSLEFFLDFPSAVICSGSQGLYISSCHVSWSLSDLFTLLSCSNGNKPLTHEKIPEKDGKCRILLAKFCLPSICCPFFSGSRVPKEEILLFVWHLDL